MAILLSDLCLKKKSSHAPVQHTAAFINQKKKKKWKWKMNEKWKNEKWKMKMKITASFLFDKIQKLSLPDRSTINSPTPEGWKALLAHAVVELQTSTLQRKPMNFLQRFSTRPIRRCKTWDEGEHSSVFVFASGFWVVRKWQKITNCRRQHHVHNCRDAAVPSCPSGQC